MPSREYYIFIYNSLNIVFFAILQFSNLIPKKHNDLISVLLFTPYLIINLVYIAVCFRDICRINRELRNL